MEANIESEKPRPLISVDERDLLKPLSEEELDRAYGLGFRLLSSLGYKHGSGIGADSSRAGITQPLSFGTPQEALTRTHARPGITEAKTRKCSMDVDPPECQTCEDPSAKRMRRIVTIVTQDDKEVHITQELANILMDPQLNNRSVYTEWKDSIWVLSVTKVGHKYKLSWIASGHTLMKCHQGDTWEEVYPPPVRQPVSQPKAAPKARNAAAAAAHAR